jgi:hypothetical protein
MQVIGKTGKPRMKKVAYFDFQGERVPASERSFYASYSFLFHQEDATIAFLNTMRAVCAPKEKVNA